jgi:DnaJ-class molecular chaperone
MLCMQCGGHGSVSKRGLLTAEVPPGVVSGDTIRTSAFVDTLGEVEVEFRVIVAE